jgi:hypothetical protein
VEVELLLLLKVFFDVVLVVFDWQQLFLVMKTEQLLLLSNALELLLMNYSNLSD